MEIIKIPVIKNKNSKLQCILEDIFDCQPINENASLIFRTYLWTPDMFKKSEPRQRIIIRNINDEFNIVSNVILKMS